MELAALHRLRDSRWAWLGWGLLYGAAWMALLSISHALWFLPAGLRLGALWLLPTRRWGWLAAGEWSAQAVLALFQGWPVDDSVFVTLGLAPLLVYALVVRLVRGAEAQPQIDDSRGMLSLLSAGVLSAALVSPLLQYFLPEGADGGARMVGIFAFLYGDFLGQLVIAPLLVMLFRTDLRQRLQPLLWRDVLLQLLFSLAVFWLIRQRQELEPYILLLAFAPIFFVAFRHGWEGAALSVSLVGLLIEGLLRMGAVPIDVRILQLGLTVIGGGGLVLGAASSELRRSHERLALRHRELGQVNRSLGKAAIELRSVSQRLVRLEEQGQRELALDLDYELGQAIHALSTHISLAFRDARNDQQLRLLESMREQVREMQDSLRRVVRQLRPSVLDSHGLREALGYGPLREMLDDAGIGYEVAFYGRVEALSDDAQTTVYRICQAAVREACRSQSIRRMLVQVDVVPGQGHRLEVLMRIDAEATPFLDYPIEPLALPPITDRVLAQQGSYRVENLAPGVRHLVSFEEDAAALL